MKVLVSACLLGRRCRYDGGHKETPALRAALAREGLEAVPFCPEEAGGLGTPRPAAQLIGGTGEAVLDGTARVLTAEGRDVTGAYLAGARAALEQAQAQGCRTAYLMDRSPSCGCSRVHTGDGLQAGCGVTTALLRRAGIETRAVEA